MNDMKQSISCDDKQATVSLSATFSDPVEAIIFNEKLAALCRSTATPRQGPRIWHHVLPVRLARLVLESRVN